MSPPPSEETCRICPAYELGFCEFGRGLKSGSPSSPASEVYQSVHGARPREIAFRKLHLADAFPIVCFGWASAFTTLGDGQRAVLSFLLAGDAVSAALLFDTALTFSVEAITHLSYRIFKRSDLRRVLIRSPELYERISSVYIEEKARADNLIVDLGCCTAEERIARLIIGLAQRLVKRGRANDGSAAKAALKIEFPLRQHHVAQATGLTPVHVSKVLRGFRRRNLIELSERSLTILDLEKFKGIAHNR